MSGFVITVFCEEFFEDARKSVALFYHQDRMKTVKDLKQRLKSLVRKDFHVLWSPHDEESFHFLLDDEELHFLKPKDKFRLCKIKKSSTNDLVKKENTVNENNTSSEEHEEIDSNHATNGINETTENIISDDLMEYEDVVDQGSNKKKRKRTRKHKSKKQKVDISPSNTDIVPVANDFKPITEPVLLHNSFEKNNGSHIRFQGEVTSNDQVDSKQENETENIWYKVENIETVEKKKKKSKKTKLVSSHESSIQFNEQDNIVTGQSEEPSTVLSTAEYTSGLVRENDSTTHIVTSTAVNSPASVVKKCSRKTYSQSLAGFINRLSESMKHQPKSNGFTDDINISEINEATSPFSKNFSDSIVDDTVVKNETPDNASKHTEFSPHVTKLINSIKKCKVKNQEQNPSESAEFNNIQHSDRKLGRILKNQANSHQSKIIEDPHTVLENLKQLKFANYPDMPLIFERKNLRRECISKEKGDEEIATVKDVSELNVTVKQNGACPVATNELCDTQQADATNGFGDMQQTVSTNKLSDIQEAVSRARTMTIKEISTLPVVKSPKENDVILFKILKMDESYNPSLSSYVCAKINSICSVSSQLLLNILHGTEELKPPVGKFSLEEEDERTQEEEICEHSINWNEIYESRLLSREATP